MTIKIPWEEIEIPANEISVLRASSEHPHNFFWARDVAGHYLFVLRCPEEELRKRVNRRNIDLTGIKTDFRLLPGDEGAYLMLLLQEEASADIFLTLCNDLMQKTASIGEIGAAMDVLFSRLEKWRIFLSRTRKNLLSDLEIQGLFAELKFMEECLENQVVTPNSIIDGWQGPLGGSHDFVLNQSAVEIKSLAGTQSESVPISSENQLITHLEHLYLTVFLFSRDPDGTTGLSLNTLVKQMQEKFAAHNLQDEFEDRLMKSGYINIKEYNLPTFAVADIRPYLIGEGFPRITPDALPPGVTQVSYSINLSSIADYRCELSTIGGNQ